MQNICSGCKYLGSGPTASGKLCKAGAPAGVTLANGGTVTACASFARSDGKQLLTESPPARRP